MTKSKQPLTDSILTLNTFNISLYNINQFLNFDTFYIISPTFHAL